MLIDTFVQNEEIFVNDSESYIKNETTNKIISKNTSEGSLIYCNEKDSPILLNISGNAK